MSQVLAEGLNFVFFTGSSVLGSRREQKRIHLAPSLEQRTLLCLDAQRGGGRCDREAASWDTHMTSRLVLGTGYIQEFKREGTAPPPESSHSARD